MTRTIKVGIGPTYDHGTVYEVPGGTLRRTPATVAGYARVVSVRLWVERHPDYGWCVYRQVEGEPPTHIQAWTDRMLTGRHSAPVGEGSGYNYAVVEEECLLTARRSLAAPRLDVLLWWPPTNGYVTCDLLDDTAAKLPPRD